MSKKVAAAPAPPPVTYTNGMDKLRDEMAKSKSTYVRVVGEYMTNYLLEHPEAEAAILTKDKTLQGSLEAMRKEAQKHRDGNVAVLDDATGFRIVREYFGIEEGETTSSVTAGAATPSPKGEGNTAAAPVPSQSLPLQGKVPPKGADEVVPKDDPFDLDALLGGVL